MKRNVPAFQAPSPTPEAPIAVKTGYRILLWGVPLLAGVYFLIGMSPPLLSRYGQPEAEAVLNLYNHFCHQIPERSFVIGGTPLSLCSRCTGFYGGLFWGSLTVARSGGGRSLGLRISALLVAPALIDFWFDLSSLVWGSNMLRCLSGLLAAIGVVRFGFPRLLWAARR
ncbi:MAG: DUF2085 domain-containing protein [candidate division Zixibacteria bacterium]|nr:DUF2085 domain-containing protein [candidate division Zixibacteria bacterium]